METDFKMFYLYQTDFSESWHATIFVWWNVDFWREIQMFVTTNMKTDSLLAHSRNPLESTKGGLACSPEPADELSIPQQEVPVLKCIKLTKKKKTMLR